MKNSIYYIYLHRRLDTNEVFYVGKGKNNRAYSKANRNKYWINIVDKVGYSIEILYKNLLESDAFKKEIEMIKMLSPVANLTKGGEGGNTFELLSDIDKNNFIEESKKRANRENSGVKIAAKLRKGKTKETDSGLKRMVESLSESFSGEGNPMYGKSHWNIHSEEEKEKIKDQVSKTLKETYLKFPRTYNKVTCPHCNKIGGKPGMTRYHFNNCKYIK